MRGQCKGAKPILEKLAKEYAGQVDFLPINADDSQEVLEQFYVCDTPTMITLRNGKEIARVMGTQNETNYRAMFEALADGREMIVLAQNLIVCYGWSRCTSHHDWHLNLQLDSRWHRECNCVSGYL